MPERCLAWHRGSVLPYASLWHTVLRACALNALYPADLPTTGARPAQSLDLFDIQAGKIDVAALARALGEPPEVFRWSTLDALPDPLRVALAVPQPRVCLACLAAGYHSALFSVALLDACPIHHTALVGRCHCGAPFDAALRSLADFRIAGSCPCGQLHFFTHETCRRSTMTPDMTHALTAVVAWLHSLSQLIRPSRLDLALSQQAPGSLEWLITTAQSLGIAYPACLRHTISASARIETVAYGSPSRLAPHRDRPSPTDAQESERTPLSQTVSAFDAYRAIARHVRRHVAPDGDLWISRFMDSCDPIEIGELICHSRNAQTAFITMLWARSVEPGVERRRWPHRLPASGFNNTLAEIVADDCRLCGADNADTRTRHWLTCHAARVSLGALWRDAQARASGAARFRLATWYSVSPGTSWRDSAWLALATPHGVRFVAETSTNLPTAPYTSKTRRKAAHSTHELARRNAMWATCHGSCLSWSEANSWHVIDAISPVDFDVRHRRLLGWRNGRPWCWLYRTADGHFVARWDHAPLQVLAATPGAALAALRRCALEYQRICKVVLPFAPSFSTAAPAPMETRPALHYRFSVDAARSNEGFWRDARILAEAAHKYRSTYVLPQRTGAGTPIDGMVTSINNFS
ncbi:hypothetical protein E1N52_42665 [Paraburkholderia guartelaensis]|uniref:TniQ family protein n=1 Tax=Paraburkholderia guartelaensis TaxID=2546446 RepID=A0A4R5L2S8_9BURK|nr:hypothetical protein [Paraburkholderia guartelaensis]TDG01885.1 hypothetical protein E1N52_42665 [Paraburkholderia guartelaensis]